MNTNDIKPKNCPICKISESIFFISTKALMHRKNTEKYIFNQCLTCKSVFLTNPVSETILGTYYTDNYLPYKGPKAWGKYLSFVAKNQAQLDLKRVRFVAGIIKTTAHFSILDVGCGNPSFLKLLQKKMNGICTGIDFSDFGWKDSEYNSISLFATSIADFKPEQTYDVITLWHYLEHDYNLHETIQKLYQCLAPSGKLIIEVPDYDSVTARYQKEHWQGWHSPRHITLFSTEGFKNLFTKDKWIIIKHSRHGTLDPFTLWWLGKMQKKNIDWSTNMEKEFWPLVFLKIITFPFFIFERFFSMGIQTIVVQKK